MESHLSNKGHCKWKGSSQNWNFWTNFSFCRLRGLFPDTTTSWCMTVAYCVAYFSKPADVNISNSLLEKLVYQLVGNIINTLTSSAMVLSLLAQSSACSSTVESSVAGPCFRASAAATICCRWRVRMCLNERSRGVAHCHWSRDGSSSLEKEREGGVTNEWH